MAKSYKLILPSDRAERLQYMKRMFPQAMGPFLSDDWRGGRQEAIRRLNSIDVDTYKRNRDFLNGAVTKLSPYFRYGCLTLKEASDSAHKRFGIASEKFVSELGRRDYFRRVWYREGNGIFNNLEESKVLLSDGAMPDFIRQAITGLPCMDGFVHDLMHDGYVHNNARKWFAAYVVHWLKVDWRDAADWFEHYLLDGDKASNHLSWQWVASTFSTKPYFFNKETIARYTGEKYCATCTINCPFDASEEMLEEKLFPKTELTSITARSVPKQPMGALSTGGAIAVLVHDEMLSAANPLLRNSMPKFFVFDDSLHGKWPLKRLQFVADCISELPNVEVWLGDTATILKERGVGRLTTQNTPNLQLKSMLSPFNTEWQPEVKFTNEDISEKRLKRFSRYWSKVSKGIFGEQASRRP